jgi:poly(3-hydroxybutyrate) depolymerase
MGCWDWWGYNDFLFDKRAGTYARKDGVQIAAVWRMAERLAGGGGHLAAEGRPAPVLRVVDRSAAQVALAWTPVAGATGYIVERAEAGGEAQPRARVDGGRVSWVDDGLRAESHYRYTLRPLAGSAEGRRPRPSRCAPQPRRRPAIRISRWPAACR